MESLVISFKDRETQYCVLSVTDAATTVKGIEKGRSLIEAIKQSDFHYIAEEIEDCCKRMKVRASDIYFLLPSSLVKLDCYETSAAVGQDGWIGKLNRWVASQIAPGKEKEMVSRIAMLRTPANVVYVSAAAISVAVAQTLESVASLLGKQLRQIEPEVLGLVRKIETRKAFILEMCGEESYFTAFAPNKGVFTIKVPSPLAPDEWLGTVQNTIGFAASELFDISDASFSYFSSDSSVMETLRQENVDLVSSRQLQIDNLQVKKRVCGPLDEFLPLIFAAATQKNEELTHTALPQANFTREEVQARIRKEQTEKKAMFLLKTIQAIGVLVIIFNLGMIGYQYMTSNNSLPPQMESRFRESQQILASVDKRTQILNEAYKTDMEVVRIVDNITILRPVQVKIQRLEVSESGGIKIEAHSNAPELGNVYVQQLLQSGKQIVKTAFLEKITSANNGSVFTINGQAFR